MRFSCCCVLCMDFSKAVSVFCADCTPALVLSLTLTGISIVTVSATVSPPSGCSLRLHFLPVPLLCFQLYFHRFKHECLRSRCFRHEIIWGYVMTLENDVEQCSLTASVNQFFAVSSMLWKPEISSSLFRMSSFSPAIRTASTRSTPLITFSCLHASLLSQIFARSSSTVAS